MANVYGITHDTIREEFFPGVATFTAQTRPTATTATRIISRVSSAIDAALLSVGIASADIDAVGEPVSYAYLADTLSLGAAARLAGVGSLGAEADAVKRWAKDFEARLLRIETDPESVIPDAALAGTDAGVRSHVTAMGLTDDDLSDRSTNNSPLFTTDDVA